MVCHELDPLRPLVLWRLHKQLCPRGDVFLLRPLSHPSCASVSLVEEIHHTVTADPVLPNRVPDNVCGHMAVWLPLWMAPLPNKLHVHAHYPFLKLLLSDLQEAPWFSEEGSPEWLSSINKRTSKWGAIYGACCTREAEGGLTFENLSPNSHCGVLASAATG